MVKFASINLWIYVLHPPKTHYTLLDLGWTSPFKVTDMNWKLQSQEKNIRPFVHLCSKLANFKCSGNYLKMQNLQFFDKLLLKLLANLSEKASCAEILIRLDSTGCQS